MLGESIRRRQRPERRRPGRARPRPRGPEPRWGRWALVTLLLVAGLFGSGYGVAVWVLFPEPDAIAGDAVEVPALSGLTVSEARARLTELGLEPGEVTETPHPRVGAGIVVAQGPVAGQQLLPGSTVKLAVSTGAARAVVPDVVGLPADAATELLQRLGFGVNRRAEEGPGTPGTVRAVQPEPRSAHALPATVTLIVAEAPAPEPEDEPEDLPRFPLFPDFDAAGSNGAAADPAGRDARPLPPR